MDIQKLFDEYTNLTESKTTIIKIGEYFEITTPYLNSDNDCLQIYIKQVGNNIYLSDDGASIGRLKMNGYFFNSEFKSHLYKILQQYEVELEEDNLITKSTINNFVCAKHLLIQAMLCLDRLQIQQPI